MAWKEAAQSGNIDGLYELFKRDHRLLEVIDEAPFVDTPMHIAAASGQVDFAVEMMNLKPSFATKLNPEGLTPMHIALFHHRNLLFVLLKINEDLVRVKGKKGMTLLHYAAEQGDTDLLAKFLMTCPQSITYVTVKGKTALHIAAEGNKLGALQLLVRWILRTHNKDGFSWESDVINWTDNEGNTVLHIAASNIHNQVEMIGLLLECDRVETKRFLSREFEKSVVNSRGLTALDILQQQSDVANSKAIDILTKAGGLNANFIGKSKPMSELWRSKVGFTERLIVDMCRVRANIQSDIRNGLLVVAGLVLTTTYQALFNPPGGVRQVDAGSIKVPSDAGRSVMGTSNFILFYVSNTASFLITLTLTVIFLMIGPKGEPGELGVLPLLPLIICYFMATLVVVPTPKFNYLIWLTLGIYIAFASWQLIIHSIWMVQARRRSYATSPDRIRFNNALLHN